MWVGDVMNHTSERSLNWRPPLEVLTGQTIDISIILVFLFWDVVCASRCHDKECRGQIGSKKSSEMRGHFVGFSHDVGHALTFKVLTCDANKIIHRSRLRLAKDGENNLKLDMEAGAVPERAFIKSKRDSEGDDVVLPIIDITRNPFNDPDEHLTTSQGKKSPGETPPSDKHGETPPNDATGKDTTDNALGEQPDTMDNVLGEQPDSSTQDDCVSPMDSLPLRQHEEPTVETVDETELTGLPEGEKQYFTKDVDSLKTDGLTLPNRLPPTEMINRTFLMPPQEDGSRHRARIIALVDKHMDDMLADPERAAEIAKF